MRSNILFLFVFVSLAFSSFAQERHLKNAKAFIEKGSFEKALERINTYESSVGGKKYESYYVRYLLQSKLPVSIISKDSSLTLLKSANADFSVELDEKKKTNLCEEFQICGNDFPSLLDSVEVELFELCKVGNVEEQLNWFLKKYIKSKIFNDASKYLNQYAFAEALKQNTEVAYQAFATKYPQSEEYKIALDSLESISYHAALQANSVDRYSRFLNQYPQSNKQGLIKRKMWDKAFQEAQEIHTKSAYTEFIKKFAGSDLVGNAKKAIEKLDWESALQGNSRELFVAFVNEYPKSALIKDAQSRIEGFDWDVALKENTRKSFATFVDKYPASTHLQQALASIEAFDWAITLKENTKESFEVFLEKYPESANSKMAMASIEKFDWSEALKDSSLQALQNFLNGYPDGAFAAEAKSMMNGLKLVVPYLTTNQKYKLYDVSDETFVSEALYDKIEPLDNELFIVTNFGKKGIVNKFGDNITLATYDCFVPIGKNGIIFQLGSKFGVMDRKGETIVQPIYDDLDSQGDSLLISSIKRGKLVKMGLIDLKGHILVENKFRSLVVIGQNQMIVSSDKKIWYLANSKGNFISAPYSDIDTARIVSMKGKYGWLNEQGRLVIPTIYKQLVVANPGFFIGENIEEKQGVLDSLGRIVVPFDKHLVRYVGEGIYALIKYANSNNASVNLYSVSKNRIINTVSFEEVGSFSEGLIDFKLTGKIGYLNTEGKIVIASIFDSFEQVSAPYDLEFGIADWVDVFNIEPGDGGDEIDYEPEEGEPEDYLSTFCEEITLGGELNIQPLKQYTNKDFSDGMALVNIGNKVGAIDRNGKIVVPITYDFMTPYLHGLAVGVIKVAEQKYRPVILNKAGQVILEDYVIDTRLSNNRLIVKNRKGEYFDLVLDGTLNMKSLGKDFSNILRYKDYIKFQYKDASIYATPEFVWYSDENVDFSSFEAQKSVQSGNSLRISKEYDKALVEFKKAFRISPNNVNALIGMAETYLDQNDHYNAIKYVDQSLQVANGPIKFTAFELKFNIYKDWSKWSEAIDVASQIISEFDAVRSEWYYERSLCKYELQRFNDTIDDITLALQGEFTSSRSYIYNLRGVCYSRLRMMPYALLDFKQASIHGIKESDDDISMGIYFNNIGNTSLDLKKKDEAQVAFKKAASYGNQDAARTLRSSIFRK